jgi:predicted ferric reductase
MQPVILAVGVRKGIVVALCDLALAAARLVGVLAVRDPFVDLVVGPMLSIDEILPLADFFGVVYLLLSWLHLGGCCVVWMGYRMGRLIIEKCSKFVL